MSIGDNIKYYRKLKGLSQRQLKAVSGVHEILIAKYETNKCNPSIETIKKLAIALDVSIDDLCNDDPKKENDKSSNDSLELYQLFSSLNDTKKKEAIEYLQELNNMD